MSARQLANLKCPLCGRRQQMDYLMYMFSTKPGNHPATCRNEKCPTHTVLKFESITLEGEV